MEKQQIHLGILVCIIVFFGLVSLSLCIAAEFNKSKIEDLRIDGKQCYLPASIAFELGTAALVSLFIAQIIGNVLVCKEFRSRKHDENGPPSKTQKPVFPIVLQILSWASFGVAAILVGVGSSMNRKQAMGEGWLDGECYLVKDGVYFGSAALVVITLSAIITSTVLLTRIRQSDQGTPINIQRTQEHVMIGDGD